VRCGRLDCELLYPYAYLLSYLLSACVAWLVVGGAYRDRIALISDVLDADSDRYADAFIGYSAWRHYAAAARCLYVSSAPPPVPPVGNVYAIQ